jgi:8-oxo-dGTP diphosphatase
MALSEYIKSLRARAGPDLLLLPGVSALIFNPAGEILLQRRSDNGRWALIGGMMEPGEQPADALVREVHEETGLTISPERITGIYLTRIITYPDGNTAQYVITAFRCRPISGTPHVADDESLEVRYFPINALPELSPDHRQRIEHALANREPYFHPPTHGAKA